jgi:hypothetical protein
MQWLDTPNVINESIIDNWIARAIAYDKSSDMSLKCHCIFASPVVGKYKNGGTKAIADGIKRSVSTVENHAHAHWLYIELRGVNMQIARRLWRELPASHWWLAYDIQRAGYEALHYLDFAMLHNWSGRDMLNQYKIDMIAGNAPIQYKRLCVSIRGLADELLGRREATPAQIKAAQAVQKAFQ